MSKFIQGYQKLAWMGYPIHVYLQKADQLIGMMSAKQTGKEDYLARATIDKIDNDMIHYCKVNCNFFDMSTGQHYGVEQSFENDFAPKQDEWLCLYIDKNNQPHYCKSSEYYLTKDDVLFACSPAAILRHDDVETTIISSGASVNFKSITNRTILLYMGDGKYAFMVTSSGLNINQLVSFAIAYGAIGIYLLDGGGSSQMIVDGYKKYYTSRPIANVLTFYKKPGTTEPDPEPEPEPEPEPDDKDKVIADLKAKLDEAETMLDRLEKRNDVLETKIQEIRNIIS